jgi:hypothetical protein
VVHRIDTPFAPGIERPATAHARPKKPVISREDGWHRLAFHTLVDNLRLALRTLWRVPGSTAAAVLVLAIGVGGSTAVFSVLRGVVLRPLGLPHPDELVRLYERPAGTEVRWGFSGPDYVDVSRARASIARPRR